MYNSINAISCNYNPNFGITSKVRIPLKDGTTALLRVTGDAKELGYPKITKIICNIMKKGKSLEETQYKGAKGIDSTTEIMLDVLNYLGEKPKESISIPSKILEAIEKPSIDYNA